MAAAPKVSVCIPTYKGAATVGAAIESVLAQTFCDLELVVIDDGSPDNTVEVVSSFSDTRLRYIRNVGNLGPEGNWNRCVVEARGTYFKLLPHDDLLAPECLAKQVGVLESDVEENIALVFAARTVLGPDGRALMQRGCPGAAPGRVPARELIGRCVRRGTNLVGEPGAVMMRLALARHIGGFDGQQGYVIDLDFWFRALAHGDAWYLEAPLASFRVSASQWSVAIGRQQDHEFMELVRRMAAQFSPPLRMTDLWVAQLSAKFNMWARQLFYMLYLR